MVAGVHRTEALNVAGSARSIVGFGDIVRGIVRRRIALVTASAVLAVAPIVSAQTATTSEAPTPAVAPSNGAATEAVPIMAPVPPPLADGTAITPSAVGQTSTNTPVETRSPNGAAIAPAGTPAPAAPTPEFLRRLLDGFSFGSYGRVVVATDLRGHQGRQANIVSHGTRIDESTYAELEVHRDDDFGPVHTRVVATLGILGPLFHETGQFSVNLAVRNLYLEERGAIHRDLTLWVGSRMYRGDDAYLLDWWPLDNLNTVGGGARFDAGEHVTVAAHFGINRLDNNYQYQSVSVIPREGFGAAQVVLLDRPRFIGSLKATWWLNGRTARSGLKISLYGEVHGLPEGIRRNPETNALEGLSSDNGFVAGAQIGLYSGQRNTYVNLWFRYGQGLGAYGDLNVPYTLTATQTSALARDVVLAAAGNWESGPFGILGAAYVRYFRDADPAVFSRNQLWEGTVVVRPTVWIGNHVGIAIEGSYQAVAMNMLDPVTGVGPRTGSLWRFGVIPFVTPAGRGNFTRPHLRLIYALTVRDDGARGMYAADDPFARNSVEHFLGVGCEWWFNSSYL